jgi:hypothetical protein
MRHKDDLDPVWVTGLVLLPPVLAGLAYVIATRLVDRLPRGDATAYGDAASWVQVGVAFWTVAVTSVAAYQIVILRRQTRIQEQAAEAQTYRPLISPQMQSVKRFVWSQEFGGALQRLQQALAAGPAPDSLKLALDTFRVDVRRVARRVDLPLLGRRACLDDVEALLNEYNYICKQIRDGVVGADFATDMAGRNLRRVFDRLEPFIRLRRSMSTAYASHFVAYVESML